MKSMKEHDVQAVLVSYLLERGWTPTIDNPDHVDIRATRGAETLIIEVKGTTSDPYTDTDTLLGQILRRMGDPAARYGIALPETMRAQAGRLPSRVRHLLDLTVYLIDDLGRVSLLQE